MSSSSAVAPIREAVIPTKEIVLPDYNVLSAKIEKAPVEVVYDLLRRLGVKPQFIKVVTETGHPGIAVVGVYRDHGGARVPFVRASSSTDGQLACKPVMQACARVLLNMGTPILQEPGKFEVETFYVQQGNSRPSEGIRFVKQAAVASVAG